MWAPDGGALYATAQHLGHGSLFAIDTSSGEVTTVLDGLGYVSAPSFAGSRLVFGLDHLSLPLELFTVQRLEDQHVQCAFDDVGPAVGHGTRPPFLECEYHDIRWSYR